MKVVIYVGEGSAEYYVPDEMYARFQKELEEYHAEKKKREGWICVECGESTYEVDYDYLVSPDLHLKCFMKK